MDESRGGRSRSNPDDEQVWGNSLIGRALICFPFLCLTVWFLVDGTFPITQMWPVPLALGVITVLSLRPLVGITKDELVIRHPIGGQRIPRTEVVSARFNYFGLIISRRDGRSAIAFLMPKLTSTELSGDEPPPDSAASRITRWAQRSASDDHGD